MTDIRLVWDASIGTADWTIVDGDISLGNDLETAVLISLFTDARAPDGVVPPAQDPRGWWGDTFSQTPWGSLLWTLSRAIISNRTQLLRQAEDYANRALQWLIDDGVAASVASVATFPASSAILLVVTIQQPGQNSPQVFQYSWAWAQMPGGGN